MFRFPTPAAARLILIDMQQKLLGAMHDPDALLARHRVLLQGLNALGVPVTVTEQYPKGLGPTVPELAGLLSPETPVLTKTSFSCFGAEGFADTLDQAERPVLIVAGIEAHVCVQQTALDALNRGFQVLIPFDAVSSRKAAEADNATAGLRSLGCGVYSVEALLFMLLRNAEHPAFKTVSRLVR